MREVDAFGGAVLRQSAHHHGGAAQVGYALGLFLYAFGIFAAWLWLASFLTNAVVVGALGLLGLAFGLAFQDVLKSWISGFFLLLERPFRIGDDIRISQWEGSVESVLMRVTVLRSGDGEKIQIPNQQVFTSAIVNRSSYPTRRLVSTAKIADNVELNGLLGRGMAEVKRVRGIAADPAPAVALVPRADLGPSIEASYWIDYHREDASRVKGEVDARLAHVAAGSSFDDAADLAVVGRAAVKDPGEQG